MQVVFDACVDRHRHAAAKDDFRLVGDKTRLWDDDLVTRVNDSRHRQVERFRHAHGDEQLGFRVVPDAIELLEVAGQRAAQLDRARVGRVMRFALAQAVHPGTDDLGWRHKIRLADAQADDVLHRRGDFEEAAETGRRNVSDLGGDQVAHGCVFTE